jgi:hypothetical protein
MITSWTWLSRERPAAVMRTKRAFLMKRAQLLDGGEPGVAHAGAQAADELVDDGDERAAVGDAALDALGHELLVGGAALTVAIFAARFMAPSEPMPRYTL